LQSNEPAAGENARPNSAEILEDTNNNVNTSRRAKVGASHGIHTTRYSLRQQRESILCSNPRLADSQAQSRDPKLSGAESRLPDSNPESNDESSDLEQVRDSDSEYTELYAPVANAGSAAMDDPLNPAAAQLVVDLRAFGMQHIDPYATMPNNENTGSCSKITRSSKSPDSRSRPPSILRFKQEEPTSSPNFESRFPRLEGVLDRLSNAMTSWSILKTWLLSKYEAIHDELFVRVPLSRIYTQLLNRISSLASIIVAITIISALVVFFSPLIWLVVWAWDIPVNAIDHWTKDTCYWSWLSPICSYGCSISPWFVVYLFSNTCSHHMSQKGPTVDPLWQTAIASDEMDNIPWLIALRESHCYYYSVGIEQFRDALPISEDAKNTLQPMQDKICSELEDTSSYRSSYRRHVNIFSAAVLHSVDIEQAQTPEASSYSMLEQQNKLNEVMPDLMAQWQKRYDYFGSPGRQMSEEVRASRQKVVTHLKILLHLKEETSRARTDKIKTWKLPRRAARGIGLLRSDPPELYGYNDALEALDGWILETMAVVRLYTMIEIELAELDSSLRDAAARKFSTDVRFRLGPEGLLELYSYWMGHSSEAPDVGKLMDGARMNQREESLL